MVSGEDAAGDGVVVARRGDHDQLVDPGEHGEIGGDGADRRFIAQQDDRGAIPAGTGENFAFDPERGKQSGVGGGFDQGGGQVEHEHVIVAGNGEDARTRGETDDFAHQQYMCRCKCCMTAQIDLDGRGEPAQMIIGFGAVRWDRKRGLAEIILGRDRLERRIIEPGIEWHHRRRVAGERPLGEGIDLEEGQDRHQIFSVRTDGSIVSRSVCPSGSRWMRISVAGKRL